MPKATRVFKMEILIVILLETIKKIFNLETMLVLLININVTDSFYDLVFFHPAKS